MRQAPATTPPRATRPPGERRSGLTTRARVACFAVVVLVCAGVAIAQLEKSSDRLAEGAGVAPLATTATAADLAAQARQPSVIFRSTAYGPTYGKVGLLPLDRLDGPRLMSGLECDRVDMAGGRGLCMHTDQGVLTTYSLVVFNGELRQVGSLPLAGLPSRTRLSPSGRVAAATVFVSGDSYAADSFSTRTTIIDMVNVRAVVDLEDYAVVRDGQPFNSTDFNYWGVTFAPDENTFYATLGTGTHRYLVQGDMAARTARVLRDGVECPSLSPDGTRIAFKQRSTGAGPVRWKPAVLDLDTLAAHPLAEAQNVDDQIAWLDNATVTYGRPEAEQGTATTHTWAASADGTGVPRLLIPPVLVVGDRPAVAPWGAVID